MKKFFKKHSFLGFFIHRNLEKKNHTVKKCGLLLPGDERLF